MTIEGGSMKTIHILVVVFLITIGTVSLVRAAGPSGEMARNAYKQVLLEADKNKDGKLSLAECKAMFKDNAKGEKNCGFWDADHDGTITEDEYVAQAMSIQRKR
jgi:Ca2+-binding EF-hand superfamily protein